MRTPSAPTPAVRRRQRATVNAPIFYVANPGQDWKRHYAQLRNNRMVQLWDGGRPVVLTMCGRLGQTCTEVRHAEDCEGCKRARAEEQSATVEMQRPLLVPGAEHLSDAPCPDEQEPHAPGRPRGSESVAS